MNPIQCQSRHLAQTILVVLIALVTFMPVAAAASCVSGTQSPGSRSVLNDATHIHAEVLGQADPCQQSPEPDQHAITITFALPPGVGSILAGDGWPEARQPALPHTAASLSPPAIGHPPDAPPPKLGTIGS